MVFHGVVCRPMKLSDSEEDRSEPDPVIASWLLGAEFEISPSKQSACLFFKASTGSVVTKHAPAISRPVLYTAAYG